RDCTQHVGINPSCSLGASRGASFSPPRSARRGRQVSVTPPASPVPDAFPRQGGEGSRGSHKGGKHAEYHTGARLWYGVFVLCTRICPDNAYGRTAAARTRDHERTTAADAGKDPAAGESARETQHAATTCTAPCACTTRCR